MADRDKVIKGLECCILRNPDDHARCSQCPYESNCVNRLKIDALELLKEQDEPLVPIRNADNELLCRNCGVMVGYINRFNNRTLVSKYCPECGRMVKWNE